MKGAPEETMFKEIMQKNLTLQALIRKNDCVSTVCQDRIG